MNTLYRNSFSAIALAVVLLVGPVAAQPKRLTAEKLYALGRIGDAVVSPYGKQVAYTVSNYDLAENA